MINFNFSSRMLQGLVILAAILHIKLVSGQSGGVPHTVVVTFEPDDGTGDVTVGTEDGTRDVDLPKSCNKYVTNIGRAVDMALVTINVVGGKDTKVWQTFSRLNGRLTQMENHLDDLNEQLNHATQDHQRKLCGGDCYEWCRWMPWYCYCCPCCGNARRRERRNLRARQLQVTEDQDLEELEILAEHEVAKQLGRWKKEITCIKRTWDDHKQRWDYSESVNVEIVPVDGKANDRSADDAKDVKKRKKHKSDKRKKKAKVVMEMRKKIRETKQKILEAQEKLQRALEEEQQAEVEAEAAYVDIDDIKEDHAKVAACMEVNEPTTAVNEEPTIAVQPIQQRSSTGTRPMSSILKHYGGKSPWTPGNLTFKSHHSGKYLTISSGTLGVEDIASAAAQWVLVSSGRGNLIVNQQTSERIYQAGAWDLQVVSQVSGEESDPKKLWTLESTSCGVNTCYAIKNVDSNQKIFSNSDGRFNVWDDGMGTIAKDMKWEVVES